MNDEAKKAISVLRDGGIVIFPTDTAFGIGCRVDDAKAVEKLFRIRKRSETKATPVLISNLEMAREYWQSIPDLVLDELIKPYWPGGLTIILRCNRVKVPNLVRGGGKNLGLRMPDSDLLLQIINEVGVPILGTSANFAGEKTPYNLEDLDPELIKLVDYVLKPVILNPSTALREKNKASTVIDCSVLPWKILRQGSVKIQINRILV